MVIDTAPIADAKVSALADQFAREGFALAKGLFSPAEV